MPESILVLTHAGEASHSLSKASLETVTAGKELSARLNAPMTIGIISANYADTARSLAGVNTRVLGVAGEPFVEARYATDAAACEALCRAANPTIILAPQSSRMARVAAALAHRLSGCIDTHVTSVRGEDSPEISRWFYRQRIEGVITRSMRPWILLLEAGTYSAYSCQEGEIAVEQIAVALPAIRTSVSGTRAPAQDAQTIRPDAKMLFVAGAGWTKKQPDGLVHASEAGDLILAFLRQSGASLGSSKSLVDQGGDGQPVLPFLTHLNQVGQTGSTPRHPKGLATCCHGEEPHVVGWRFIGDRRAISLDPNCGWARGKADVVYVADAFKVMSKVNELLRSKA